MDILFNLIDFNIEMFLAIKSNILYILIAYILPIAMTVLLYIYKRKFAWLAMFPPVIVASIIVLLLDWKYYRYTFTISKIVEIFYGALLFLSHFGILIIFVITILFIIKKIIRR